MASTWPPKRPALIIFTRCLSETRQLFPACVFAWMLLFGGFWKYQDSAIFETNFIEFWISYGIVGRVYLKRPQDSFGVTSNQFTWASVDLSWDQVASKLSQVGLMLGASWPYNSSWVHVASSCVSPASLEPWPLVPPPSCLLERQTSLLASQTSHLGFARTRMEPFWNS